MLIITSVLSSERMEPNKYEVTSVFNPLVMLVIIIPNANALVEMRAIRESPFIFVDELSRSNKNEAITVTGIAIKSGLVFNAMAIAREPNPTWLSPSPIIE